MPEDRVDPRWRAEPKNHAMQRSVSKRHRSRRSRDQRGANDARERGQDPGTRREDEATSAGPAQTTPRPDQAAEAAARPPRWWERFPGRREFELEALTEAGLKPEVLEDGERLVVGVTVEFDGGPHRATIHFPDLYPYLRCEVLIGDLELRKHQNPFGKNLCLLDRSTADWEVTDTAARLIVDQLPKVEEAASDTTPRPDLEVPQAEPLSSYYEGAAEAGSLILLPPEAVALAAGHRAGTLNVVTLREGERLRGVVTAVNQIRGTLPQGVRSVVGGQSRAVEWIRLDRPPAPPDVLLAELFRRRTVTFPPLRDGDEALFAIAFPEDVTYSAAPELAWLFIRMQQRGRDKWAGLVRTERVDASEQALRTPALVDLPSKRVAVFGLGGIGAPLVHQLCQMRVGQLRLVDHDLVRVGNAVRWPLGFDAAGWPKVAALARFAQLHYPETEVIPRRWRIGGSALDATMPNEDQLLDETLKDVDLVIDATAEPGLQHLLTESARERGLPIITAEGRAGGYGGVVVRYRPERPGCYVCFKLHQQDDRFVVADDPAGRGVQPRGCADRTFTGAVFDLVPIASLTARLAAQTLAGDHFVDAPYEIALLYNHDDGEVVPRWEYHELLPHPACPRCISAVS
jgi:molybdopterin/thiamine biosynthesis adenylyltransferase